MLAPAGAAQVNNPSTCSSFETCLGVYKAGGYAGLGFVFTAADPYFGVDLDACRDPATDGLTGWGDAVLKHLSTYAEVSPSGTGVKCIGRGKLPGDKGRTKKPKGIDSFGDKAPEIKFADHGAFWTLTGQVLPAYTACTDAQVGVDGIFNALWPGAEKKPTTSNTGAYHDKTFTKLLADCDNTEKGDRSERDFALLAYLVRKGLTADEAWAPRKATASSPRADGNTSMSVGTARFLKSPKALTVRPLRPAPRRLPRPAAKR